MTLLIVSFIAGVLTALAPCVLPLLPVVIGSSASGRSKWTPYIVVASLAVSIILFTYLLKASTVFVMVPPEVWTYLSGGILLLFGLTLTFPVLWEHVPGLSKLSTASNKLAGSGFQKKSFIGDVMVGVALGPIFSTCSPTYFVILASVLPVSFALGTVYIFAYVFGLSLILLLVGLLGRRFIGRLSKVADSHGFVKRSIGVLFIILGLFIATGYEKKIETAILDSGYLDVTKIEQSLLKNVQTSENDVDQEKNGDTQKLSGYPYREIVNPSGFVNTDPITIGQFVGDKVILVDFLTYSCINCQRTFPYMNAWYEEYRDQGLVIIGIHTPEFAFEKDIDNVREAMKKFGIEYPIVLDNDYSTWNAWGNRYWPRKYLIDIHGNVVYDHIGEGGYEETELKIRELLKERAEVLGEGVDEETGALATDSIAPTASSTNSPETYFGAERNQYLGNGTRGVEGVQTFSVPSNIRSNTLYLGGKWNITPEYAENVEAEAKITYKFDATAVHIVAAAEKPVQVTIMLDGEDVGTQVIQANTLYTLVSNVAAGEHTLELIVHDVGLDVYTFTFG